MLSMFKQWLEYVWLKFCINAKIEDVCLIMWQFAMYIICDDGVVSYYSGSM